MEYDTTLAAEAFSLAEKWDTSRSEADISKLSFHASDLASFNANQKSKHPSTSFALPLTCRTPVVFLERLQSYPALPSPHITHLGELYGFLTTPNAELRWRFYEVALLDPTSSAAQSYAGPAARWVTGTDGTGVIRGRMKFCRPTFRAVARADRPLAVEIFTANKDAFHPIARRLIEKVRIPALWGPIVFFGADPWLRTLVLLENRTLVNDDGETDNSVLVMYNCRCTIHVQSCIYVWAHARAQTASHPDLPEQQLCILKTPSQCDSGQGSCSKFVHLLMELNKAKRVLGLSKMKAQCTPDGPGCMSDDQNLKPCQPSLAVAYCLGLCRDVMSCPMKSTLCVRDVYALPCKCLAEWTISSQVCTITSVQRVYSDVSLHQSVNKLGPKNQPDLRHVSI